MNLSNQEAIMKPLSIRSKITIRYTTAPSDMGYGGVPTQWRSQPGRIMGVRRAAEYAHELSQQIGQGTCRLIEYRHGSRVVELAELREIVAEAEWREMQRR
jgi:hypothetical protein